MGWKRLWGRWTGAGLTLGEEGEESGEGKKGTGREQELKALEERGGEYW